MRGRGAARGRARVCTPRRPHAQDHLQHPKYPTPLTEGFAAPARRGLTRNWQPRGEPEAAPCLPLPSAKHSGCWAEPHNINDGERLSLSPSISSGTYRTYWSRLPGGLPDAPPLSPEAELLPVLCPLCRTHTQDRKATRAQSFWGPRARQGKPWVRSQA